MDICKGRAPQGAPGSVGRAILPQRGPTPGERSEPLTWRGEGWVSPPGGSFFGGGASEGGVQGGKPRRGRRGTPFAPPHPKGGQG